MFSLVLRRWVLLLLLCVSIAPCAWARRGTQSMGANISQSDLIVVADAALGEKPLDVLLAIREVLKGDGKLADQTLHLARSRSIEDPLPRNAQNIAVLLKRYLSPAGGQSWGTLETYAQPAQIAALKTLIPVYELPTERARLLALQALWPQRDTLVQAQFLEVLALMREERNFDLLLDFYPHAQFQVRKTIIEKLASIADYRALPLLISIMENQTPDPQISPQENQNLRYLTAHKLKWYFPGAPGVTDAFRRIFPNATGSLQVLAAQYLNAREPDAKYRAVLPLPTAWWRAETLYKNGDQAGAWKLWWQVLAEPQPSEFQLSWAAQYLLPHLKDADKSRLRVALLPLLRGDVESNKYLYPESAAKILRAVGQQADVDLLLKLLDMSSNINARPRYLVTMTLRELGAPARQIAAAHLLQSLRNAQTAQKIGTDETQNLLLELAWLGSQDDWQSAQTIVGNSWQASVQKLNDLFVAINGNANGNDEISVLISLLETPRDLPIAMQEWIIFRLGDMGTARAVPVLTKFLDTAGLSNWPATTALARIGQSSAENKILVVDAATQRLRDPADGVRTQAIHLIETLQGEKARPLLRRMVVEADFGSKGEAISALGRVGTPEDLPLLLPLLDYWTNASGVHYWAMSAVTNIRDRFDLDIDETTPTA